MKWIIGIVVVVVLVVVGWFFIQGGEIVGEICIEISVVQIGSVCCFVVVLGVVWVFVMVEVGLQLFGQLVELYVDFNDMVEEGQVIVQFDLQIFEICVCEVEVLWVMVVVLLVLQCVSYQ